MCMSSLCVSCASGCSEEYCNLDRLRCRCWDVEQDREVSLDFREVMADGARLLKQAVVLSGGPGFLTQCAGVC